MTAGERDDLNLDPIKREAIAWVRKVTSGTATPADAEALRTWRSKSPDHAAAFATASLLWRDLGRAGENLRRREREPARALLGRRAFMGGSLAASVAAGAYLAVRPPLGLWPSASELSADFRTAPGEQRNIAYSDDVSIRMNTRTSIKRQPSEAGTDRVRLVAGEASFATLRKGHFLSVIAADSEIAATAARFDVSYLFDDEGASVCATCLEGELRVVRGAESAPLAAGQQLRYGTSGAMQVRPVDIDVISAWHQGVLIFRATPLREAVAQVNRYRSGRIVVTNAELGRVPVNGRFRVSNIDDILTQFEQAFGAKLRTLPGNIVLLS
jgi:transmembrane sensor